MPNDEQEGDNVKLKLIIALVLANCLIAGSAIGSPAQAESAADEAPAVDSVPQDPSDPMATASFTFDFVGPLLDDMVLDPTLTTTDRGESSRGYGIVDLPIEAGDSRASGLWTHLEDFDLVGRVKLSRHWTRIVNDDGAWSGTGTGVLRLENGEVAEEFALHMLLGDGGYEGLTLILTNTSAGWRGHIVPSGSVPPFPELPVQ